MMRQQHTITIEAPRDRVWRVMLEHPTYERWTEVFAPGSTYVGSWEEGAEIRFLAPSRDEQSGDGASGEQSGLVARVVRARRPEHVALEHIGTVTGDQVDTASWAGAEERYTLTELDGGARTEVVVDVQLEDDHDMAFEETWPRALARLKEIAEAPRITVEALVAAPADAAWRAYTTPADIVQWNAASDDWHTTAAEVDLRAGGSFSWRMEARDGSTGFDFAGTYTTIVEGERIEYEFGGRYAEVTFTPEGARTRVTVTFDPETELPMELQRDGWQAILDRFAKHVEEQLAAHRR